MLNKKLIKDIQSLGLKKHRQESGRFIAEGPKIVRELMDVIPGQVESVYATKSWLDQNRGLPVAVEEVDEAELERISQLKTPNEVLAVLKKLPSEKPVLKEEICLYLDTIKDPGNFGTIIRTADWFGIKHVVASSGSADLYNPKVVQSTMASLARVNVWYDQDENFLREQHMHILAATLNGRRLDQFGHTTSCILLIGNESSGIRQELLSLATDQVTIPRIGSAESLNAAVATGIILSKLAVK
jgi:RNA methyltransferase, TrmH family